MNWTGGKLNRHSKKSGQNAIVEKQKAHFSRIRTTLQNGPTHTAFRPRIFGEDHASNDGGGQHASVARNAQIASRKQSTLDNFDDFAPVVERLSSMSATPFRVHERHRSASKALPPLGIPNEEQSLPQPQPSSAAKRKQSDDAATTSKHFKVPRSDNLTATNILEQQRQMLLGNSDWVGLEGANIVHMDFVSDRGKENFGKRRKVERPVRPDDEHARRVYVSSVRDYPARDGGPDARDVAPSESVQIRIGDDALTSRMSVSQRVQTPSRALSLQAESPDSMLLDDDVAVSPHINDDKAAIPKRMHHNTINSESPLARKTPYSRDTFIETTDEDYEKAPGPSSLYEYARSEMSVAKDRDVESAVTEDHTGGLAATIAFINTKGSEGARSINAQDLVNRALSPTVGSSAGNPNRLSPLAKMSDLSHHHPSTPGGGSKPAPQAPIAQMQLRPTASTTAHAIPSTRTHQSNAKSAGSARSTMPPTPASLKALEALCQAETKPPATALAPPRPIPPSTKENNKPKLDPDAAWKAFVFGGVGNTLADDEDEEAPLPLFLARTKRPPTSSMDVVPPTPARERKERSSSILTSIPSPSGRDQPADAKTTAATVAPSSSNAFQSDSRASPVKVVKPSAGTKQSNSSPASQSDIFDRPSSIANASIMPAILRTDKPVLKMRRSSPDPLAVDHDGTISHYTIPANKHHPQRRHKQHKVIFNRPRPYDARKGNHLGRAAERDEEQDIVYIGEGGRAREMIHDLGSEDGETEAIEDAE